MYMSAFARTLTGDRSIRRIDLSHVLSVGIGMCVRSETLVDHEGSEMVKKVLESSCQCALG